MWVRRVGRRWPPRPAPPRPAEPLRLLQSEKLLLYDTLQGELQERIQRLEEDRQSLDINSGEASGQPAPLCFQRPFPVWALPSPLAWGWV